MMIERGKLLSKADVLGRVALHGVLKFLFLEWYYDTLFDRSG